MLYEKPTVPNRELDEGGQRETGSKNLRSSRKDYGEDPVNIGSPVIAARGKGNTKKKPDLRVRPAIWGIYRTGKKERRN
jgi:hypothetical protein